MTCQVPLEELNALNTQSDSREATKKLCQDFSAQDVGQKALEKSQAGNKKFIPHK